MSKAAKTFLGEVFFYGYGRSTLSDHGDKGCCRSTSLTLGYQSGYNGINIAAAATESIINTMPIEVIDGKIRFSGQIEEV